MQKVEFLILLCSQELYISSFKFIYKRFKEADFFEFFVFLNVSLRQLSHSGFELQFYLQKILKLRKLMIENRIEQEQMQSIQDKEGNIQKNLQVKSQQNQFQENSQNYFVSDSKEVVKIIKNDQILPKRIENIKKQRMEQMLDQNLINQKLERQQKRMSCEVKKQNNIIKKELKDKFEQDSQERKKNKILKNDRNQAGSESLRKNIYDKIKQLQNLENFKKYQSQRLKYQKNNYLNLEKQQIKSQQLLNQMKKQKCHLLQKDIKLVYSTPDINQKQEEFQKSNDDVMKIVKPVNLPKGFNYLLEMLNISYLFPELFKFEQETIFKIILLLQAPLNSFNLAQNQFSLQTKITHLLEQDFKNFLKTLTYLLLQDLSSEKLQTFTNSRAFNILSLAKFCQENQLLDFVFKFNWPIIILQLIGTSLNQNEPFSQYSKQNRNIQFLKSVQFIKDSFLKGDSAFPQNFLIRFQMISILIDCYSKTNSFRDMFNKKIQSNRNINKRKNQLQEEKRNIEQTIKKIHIKKTKKTKNIIKNGKKKVQKVQNQSEKESEKDVLFEDGEQASKLQKQLNLINQEIQNQSRLDCLSCAHYLGKDSYNNLYWYIKYFSDKLFLEKPDSSWSFFSLDQISFLIQKFINTGFKQTRLCQKLHEYFKYQLLKNQFNMQMETDQNNTFQRMNNSYQTSSTIIQKNINNLNQHFDLELQKIIAQQNDSSKDSGQNKELLMGLGMFKIDKDSLLKMIEVGQKKMSQYLKDRNSRWGSQESKQNLFSTLRGNQKNWFQEVKKQISNFNQKICVVEIQYKVFVEQSVEQVDSKIKKIQTKIWGINEKYKHNWYDFINECHEFSQLFYAVSILYNLIKKYTSKHRKLRKQYQQIKQKTVWKTTPKSKQWKQNWNQICQVCGGNGQVLCCDYCPKVYHLQCINLQQIPNEQFKCKSCVEQITTRNQLKNFSNEGKKNNRK